MPGGLCMSINHGLCAWISSYTSETYMTHHKHDTRGMLYTNRTACCKNDRHIWTVSVCCFWQNKTWLIASIHKLHKPGTMAPLSSSRLGVLHQPLRRKGYCGANTSGTRTSQQSAHGALLGKLGHLLACQRSTGESQVDCFREQELS